ncbi:MAG: hypothetical protein IPO21_12910 [Bacteroidales bacterium]|nr:hypothetical protein [Bacteroidales bacterium]
MKFIFKMVLFCTLSLYFVSCKRNCQVCSMENKEDVEFCESDYGDDEAYETAAKIYNETGYVCK